MKYIFLLLLSISAFAQEGRAIISLDKDNIVYRGIDNLLKIGVPGLEQTNITVTSTGGQIKPIENQPGYYKWNVTSVSGMRSKVMITYKNANGKTVVENKEFRVVPVPPPYAYIENQKSCCEYEYHLTRKQIANLKLNTTIDTYHEHGDAFYKVEEFTLYMPKDTITIQGNTIPDSIKVKIESLQTGSVIIINHIRRNNPDPRLLLKGVAPLTIEVVDDPLPYKEEELPGPIAYSPQFRTLYRGIENKLILTVPGAKSFKATAPGLKKINDNGDYIFNVSAVKGDKVDVDFEVTLHGDSLIYYKEQYEILNIELRGLINNKGCNGCTVEMKAKDFENAVISLSFDNVMVPAYRNVPISSYIIAVTDEKAIEVKGDKITSEVYKEIQKLKPGSKIRIIVTDYNLPETGMVGVRPPMIETVLIK
ncbi:hypothetical protein AM493_04295 [Flavobacterium akiainvivens]|uniref:Gliding motility-associated protein GldM second immunoglobulin-like domain-containing protein n=1 Tax=Flavobacterium akiainvivens TaxID=1202724 RepID=A0A0M9VH97_9FLAO|nr:GldM family protein [Flavobacterium akiainvivens]KOS05336.1 hypothetical protein AM493_04295 [Flavobacterium akiainvivens]SFQ76670.1 GldM C-terminal domain-containing protein [Flavobacterium akiainvivens]